MPTPIRTSRLSEGKMKIAMMRSMIQRKKKIRIKVVKIFHLKPLGLLLKEANRNIKNLTLNQNQNQVGSTRVNMDLKKRTVKMKPSENNKLNKKETTL